MNTFSLIEVPACRVCNERAAVTTGRCLRCYDYYHRTGRERSTWVRPRINQCVICQERYVAKAGRCLRCYVYYRDWGVERPPGTVPHGRPGVPRMCLNGCPNEVIAKGRCLACYQYFRRTQRERPPPLSGPLERLD